VIIGLLRIINWIILSIWLDFARQTGITTTKSGFEKKVGRDIISLLLSFLALIT
jgi:hypothetical protein